MKSKHIPRPLLLAVIVALACETAWAKDDAKKAEAAKRSDKVYTLGQITVTAHAEGEQGIGTATIDREQMSDFARDSLPDALNLLPGVAITPGSGQRNEALISIRGFDRWQVPLMIDGVRLYLPADNRIDFDRFLTPDLAEIQVQKGYVSVLNGPDGMGGAINLVSRKPVKPFEAEVRASMQFDSKGRNSGDSQYGHVGGKFDQWYYQASVQRRDQDYWRLSNDYNPANPAIQGKGNRKHSDKQDQRINLKAGFTPNGTDEYSLSFTKQEGEKNGLQSETGGNSWSWPQWDTWSLAWASHTQLGEQAYVKSRVYFNKFDNQLLRYNVARTTKVALSTYDDEAYGANFEVGFEPIGNHTLKAAFHYRRDQHTESEYTFPNPGQAWTLPNGFTEPEHSSKETTYSLALEDTWKISDQWELIAGISRDIRRSHKVEEFRRQDNPSFFLQPVADSFATNYQGALNYRFSPTGKAHVALSARTRFPNMFERFSSQFGGAASNPWLKPERARNFEIGFSEMLTRDVRVEAALFHNRVKDAIVGVAIPDPVAGLPATVTQRQNVGEATFRGYEIGVTAFATPRLELGGSYTYTDTEVKNPEDPNLRLTTTPRHKAFAYAKWQPFDALRVIPNVEYQSRRWSSANGAAGYVRTDNVTLMNLKLEYTLTPGWDVSLSARNLFDKNYQIVDGYPQEGRNFTLATRYQF